MIEVIDEIKKETKIETEPLKMPLSDINDKVNVILLMVKNESFKTKIKPYNLKLFGKSMIEWVTNAINDFPLTKVECDINDDIMPIIKSLANKNFKYTVVLYSDTPLLTKKTFMEILDYVRFKQPSVLKLTRGYVFETEYLLKVEKIYSPQVQYFNEEDFITCYNLKQFTFISDIFKNRILTYHLNNGIQILDTSTVYVDADVQIGANTKIYPNNIILGKTVIENDVLILEGNKIENSIILSNSQIERSEIVNSLIKNDCKVLPFNVIKNKSVIEEGATISSFCIVDGVKVEKLAFVQSFSSLKK